MGSLGRLIEVVYRYLSTPSAAGSVLLPPSGFDGGGWNNKRFKRTSFTRRAGVVERGTIWLQTKLSGTG